MIKLTKTDKDKGEYPTKKMLKNMKSFSDASKSSVEATTKFRGMMRNVKRIEFIKKQMELGKNTNGKENEK